MSPHLKYIAFVKTAHRNYVANKETQRQGQAYFNALVDWNPAIAERIRGTENDPFYDDSKLGDFITQVYKELVDNEAKA